MSKESRREDEKSRSWLPQIKIPYPLPLYDYEIPIRANEIAAYLIDKPETITAFANTVTDSYFLAQTKGDAPALERIEGLLKKIDSNTNEYRWEKERHHVFTPQQALGLLGALPGSQPPNKPKLPPHQKYLGAISEKLAAGYINRRFEPASDWRGALVTLNTFLEAAVNFGGQDTGILEKYFNLCIGVYPPGYGKRYLRLAGGIFGRQSCRSKG